MNHFHRALTLCAVVALLIAPLRADDEASKLRKPDATLSGHDALIVALAFSPDGKKLASVGDDNFLRVWDVNERKELFAVPEVANSHNQPKFTPDGSQIVLRSQGQKIAVVDVTAGKLAKLIPFETCPGGPNALDLSPDGKRIAVTGNSTLRVIELDSGTVDSDIELHKLYAIPGVAFSPDGKTIATAATDSTSIVIEPAAIKVLQTFKLTMRGDTVLFADDGKKLLTMCDDSVLTAIKIENGDSETLLNAQAHYDTLTLSGDGKTVVLGGGGRAPSLLSLATGKLLVQKLDADDLDQSAALSPDNHLLAGGSNQGAIHLWKVDF